MRFRAVTRALGVVLAMMAATLAHGAVPVAADPTAPSADAGVRPEPHPSILIDGDDAFLALTSGVRSGDGSAERPYVISDYLLASTHGYGIRLRNTTKHVLLEDLVVPGPEGAATRFADCLSETSLDCGRAHAVSLLGASNVTVRRLVASFGTTAVLMRDSRWITIEGARLGRPIGGEDSLVTGVRIETSAHVALRDLAVQATATPLWIRGGSSDIVVESSTFDHPAGLAAVDDARDVAFRRVLFDGVKLQTSGSVSSLAVVESEFRDGSIGVGALNDPTSLVDDALLCGNTFSRMGGIAAVYMIRPRNVEIVGNLFQDVAVSAHVQSGAGLRFERNVVENASSWGAQLNMLEARIHQNAFLPSGRGVSLGPASADATLNWWGARDGPSGVGPGSGERLVAPAGVRFDPWLEAPPGPGSECVPGGPAGALAELDASIEAWVQVDGEDVARVEQEIPG